MWFIMNEDIRKAYKEAYEKADEILSIIRYNKTKDELIPTNEIISAVEKKLDVEVKFATYDFNKFVNNETKEKCSFVDYGAAMGVVRKNGKARAIILLNEKENARKQRFSLVHELGHLMIQGKEGKEEFRVSTHIDMNLTSIPEKELEKEGNEFLLEEQQANIFALLVLMPREMFDRIKKEKDSIFEMAEIFGVEKDAIFSRFMLDLT